MRRLFLMLMLLWIGNIQSEAQQYFTIGMGYGLIFYRSDDLDRFKKTYNAMNSSRLRQPLKGLHDAIGVRWKIGYRYHKKLHAAINAGLQYNTSNDLARYHNYESRKFELKLNSLSFDFELGPTFKNFFVNGLVSVFLDRKFTLESQYTAQGNTNPKKPLDGIYEGKSNMSADLGITLGYIKEPVILTAKISYPMYTGGEENVLIDKSFPKIKNETSIFPDDYFDYMYLTKGERTYKGIGCDIDGVKVFLNLAVAFTIK